MSKDLDKNTLSLASSTVAMLSADGVEKANSGHPGMPMGAADYGVSLWLKFLQFNPSEPNWINRDRFVLSNGHGSMFIYSMLHLAGYDVSIDDLKNFRQEGSCTPGHPESFMTEGVECTTGPLGQGVANAVGMAIGEKLMATRFNSPDFDVFSHNVFCFCGDGCLMEGISGEASSLAGHLGLNNLIMVWDDNHISIAGETELAFTEDVGKRYEAYGWFVQHIDGHDFDAIEKAYQNALAEPNRPSLICARTTIGKGSPNKADTEGVHGAPLGADELKLAKKELGMPEDKEFYIPEEVAAAFNARVEENKAAFASWTEKFEAWKGSNKDDAILLDKFLSKEVPSSLQDKLIEALPTDGKPTATRKLSQTLLQVVSKEVPSLIGGSADLEPSTLTLIKDSEDVQKGTFAGKNLRFGVREHAMGAIMNGLSYYGSFIPYGSTFFCFSDYMRPSVRLAALSGLPGLFIYTHESIFLGEDGPTHQPVEHLSSLRAMPGLYVMRPADGLECAVMYRVAVEKKDAPSALLFTRQNVDVLDRGEGFDPNLISKGAYVLYETSRDKPDITFVGTGSEVSLALSAAKEIEKECSVRVVSMPSTELFAEQSDEYRNSVIDKGSKFVVVEAGVSFGWLSILGTSDAQTLVCGIDRFGASAPYKQLAEKFGFTTESVVKRVKEKFLN